MELTNQTSETRAKPKNAFGGPHDRPALPPIVVRDAFGRPLDIDSGFQRAINQARWTVAHRTRETEIGPEEWRLPGGPLPARPDFSRMTPPRVATQDALRGSLPERGYGYAVPEFSREYPPTRVIQDVMQKVRGIRKGPTRFLTFWYVKDPLKRS